jgi:hypothetical protein
MRSVIGVNSPPTDPATFHDRLRADLRAAMSARDRVAVRTLRRLLTAIANAEAVPLPDDLPAQVVNPGEPVVGARSDVPRRMLTMSDVDEIIATEAHEYDVSIETFESLGHSVRVAELRAEQAVLANYIQGTA